MTDLRCSVIMTRNRGKETVAADPSATVVVGSRRFTYHPVLPGERPAFHVVLA